MTVTERILRIKIMNEYKKHPEYYRNAIESARLKETTYGSGSTNQTDKQKEF